MKKYRIFQAFYLSFYSKELYRDVAKNWGGYTIIYLLLLIVGSWIIVFNAYRYTFINFYNVFSQKIVSQIPEVSIKNGMLRTPQKRAYVIEDKDSKENLAVIDTSGKYKTLVEANTTLLITKTHIITRGEDGVTKVYALPNNFNQTIDFQVWDKNIKTFLPYLWIPIFLVLVIFSFIYRLFQTFLYAILGKILSLILKTTLTFGQIVQITIVALTPTILLSTFFDFFQIYFQNQNKLYFVVAVVYLLYGINANKIRE